MKTLTKKEIFDNALSSLKVFCKLAVDEGRFVGDQSIMPEVRYIAAARARCYGFAAACIATDLGIATYVYMRPSAKVP